VSWDGCLSCGCQVFRLDTENCEWFAVCERCGDEYLSNNSPPLRYRRFLTIP
jgi:hypothetical protein